jgi:hypothetical protein
VPGGVVLGGGAVARAGLEQVGDGDDVAEHVADSLVWPCGITGEDLISEYGLTESFDP